MLHSVSSLRRYFPPATLVSFIYMRNKSSTSPCAVVRFVIHLLLHVLCYYIKTKKNSDMLFAVKTFLYRYSITTNKYNINSLFPFPKKKATGGGAESSPRLK